MPLIAAVLLMALVWTNPAQAQALGASTTSLPPASTTSLPNGLFVSPAISTLGVGLEAGIRANETIGFRLGGHWLNVDFDRNINDVDYDADANLASFGTLLDYHPFQGGFRLSGGLRFNFNSADLTGTPNSDVTIGGETFAASDVGTLEGNVSYDIVAPYVGLGYGATLLEGALSIGFDMGVMYQGEANVDLDAEGGALQGSAILEDNLALEEDDIEDDLDDYLFYPVVGLAVIYRF